MIALLTSCGRPDLLDKTLESLHGLDLQIHVYEDGYPFDNKIAEVCKRWGVSLTETYHRGQHEAISLFLYAPYSFNARYFVHLEDDWQFDNSYDWIADSIRIMQDDDKIIKVLCRKGSPHPCEHDRVTSDEITPPVHYGILKPWENKGITWSGFSWNPGVTRLDLLSKFMTFPKHEQDLADRIYRAGYKVAELSTGVYTHIGEGRGTIHKDPGKA